MSETLHHPKAIPSRAINFASRTANVCSHSTLEKSTANVFLRSTRQCKAKTKLRQIRREMFANSGDRMFRRVMINRLHMLEFSSFLFHFSSEMFFRNSRPNNFLSRSGVSAKFLTVLFSVPFEESFKSFYVVMAIMSRSEIVKILMDSGFTN